MSEFGFIEKLRHRTARFIPAAPTPVNAERGLLSLSFDDFPASAWTEAGPLLAEKGVNATYYLCGGLEGGDRMDRPQFTTGHMLAAHAAGHELGCHTFGHESVLAMSAAELEATCNRNAAWVAERIPGYALRTFASPFGYWSVGAKQQIARRFLAGRGVHDGVNVKTIDRGALKAIGLESRRLPGYDLEALVAEASEKKGWLIAYGHDVGDQPTPYGCTPRDVERLIDLARQAGLDILPVAAAADRLHMTASALH